MNLLSGDRLRVCSACKGRLSESVLYINGLPYHWGCDPSMSKDTKGQLDEIRRMQLARIDMERDYKFLQWVLRLEHLLREHDAQWENMPLYLPLKSSTGLAVWHYNFYLLGKSPEDAYETIKEDW